MEDPPDQTAQPASDPPVLGSTPHPIEKKIEDIDKAKTGLPTETKHSIDDEKFVRQVNVPWNMQDVHRNSIGAAKINLRVLNGTAKKAVITADYVSVLGIGFANISLTLDLATVGENGLDTGSFTGSKWYAVYLITTSKGEKLACLAHQDNLNAPTLPSGYVIARRIGSVVANAGATDLTAFVISNDWGWFTAAAPSKHLAAWFRVDGQGYMTSGGAEGAVHGFYDPT